MGIDAAQLVVRIRADTLAAQQGITGFAALLGGGGVLGLGALAAGAAVVGVGVAATKMAGDFQAGMTSLVTGAGESRDNLGLVSSGILQMAKDTGTSTKQLTDGMYMIESAGYHGASGLDVLSAAAKGAKVGNADLGTVADATTTIMKDFPNVLNGASGAVNALVATVASGKTHMEDLSSSLAMVLPTASAAHVGLNDVMGAMATMTGEGVPAANAATYLRQTLLALDAPGGAAKKALASVGLTSQEVSSTMQQSLPAALKLITDAVGKKFPEGSAAYVAAIKDISGGAKTMQGMLDLTGGHMKDFTTNVGNVGDAVKSGGKTISGWSDVQGTFNFKMAHAGEVVQTLMIQLGTKLLPVAGKLADLFANGLPPALDKVEGGVRGIIGIGSGLIRFLQDTGPAATAVKLVLGILAGAMLGMAASAIPSAIVGITASVVAFGAQAIAAGAAAIATIAAAAPFILVGAAIAAVIGIIILAVTHWKQITAELGLFKSAIGVGLGAIRDFVLNGMKKLGEFELQAIAWAKNLIPAMMRELQALPDEMLQLGAKLIIQLAAGITSAAGQVEHAVANIPVIGGALKGAANLIPHFATGGVMAQAGIALVGEQGPELVRLPSGAQVSPLGGGSMSALPASYAGGSSGAVTIVTQLTVDGRKLAEVVSKHQPGVIRAATGTRTF